jgi:hypothetical protein
MSKSVVLPRSLQRKGLERRVVVSIVGNSGVVVTVTYGGAEVKLRETGDDMLLRDASDDPHGYAVDRIKRALETGELNRLWEWDDGGMTAPAA